MLRRWHLHQYSCIHEHACVPRCMHIDYCYMTPTLIVMHAWAIVDARYNYKRASIRGDQRKHIGHLLPRFLCVASAFVDALASTFQSVSRPERLPARTADNVFGLLVICRGATSLTHIDIPDRSCTQPCFTFGIIYCVLHFQIHDLPRNWVDGLVSNERVAVFDADQIFFLSLSLWVVDGT